MIEEVLFEKLGPLSARELLSMPRAEWEHLRAGLTDHRNWKRGMVARCILCGGEVYIKTRQGRPLFAHYQGSDSRCPWYTGRNRHPDSVRAAQYRGQQESEAHRRMCELIAELCKLDERYVSSTVDQYLAPTESEYGRYPDVLVDWGIWGQFVVEYQRSHTFQTEISQRCIYYVREGIPLLWVLSSFDPEQVPQCVSDVVHRHRGNAFVLDRAAVTESRRQKTLVLSCFMSNGNGYDPPVLVRFDALKFPADHLPYYEDRLVKPLLEQNEARRRPFLDALSARTDPDEPLPIAELSQFTRNQKVDRLVAAAFSIMAEAASAPRNFASNHRNLKGMMNTYLNNGSLAPYALLLKTLIENTSQRALLCGSVGEHLNRSIGGRVAQVDEESPQWRLLRKLFPEALDPFTRSQLKEAGALPVWAT
jgi:hypothetical protein